VATSACSAGPLDRRDLHRGDRRHSTRPAQPAAGRGQVGILDYTDIDLGIRGQAIGLLGRVLYPNLSS
jgi:hypothetical protein